MFIDLFGLFQDHTLLALVPAASFGLIALFVQRRIVWLTAAAWLFYALYEAGVQARVLCSGDCSIRADLLFFGVILLILTVSALASSLRSVLRTKSSEKGTAS